ncbi:hypothetical protein PLICRDRAFT_56310 [Plicaturopsis crispa FD-325 SS-3]|nr:hypothetical protein PLICRDRAFT_56310 [Plicaturopsis crispa FD-325 SS-3]
MSNSQYHVYALPPDLLETLRPRDLVSNTPPIVDAPIPESAPSVLGARACNICLGATFTDVDGQRAHFRSDWHRYNVKVRLNGGNAVSEGDFAQLVDGLEDSLSGSASSDDDSSSDSDAVGALADKTRKLARSPSPETRTAPRTALSWFHSPPATQIGVYKVLYPINLPASSYLSELREMQKGTEQGRRWAMFMVAGGHFAGAIVQVSRPEEDEQEEPAGKKKKPKKPKPDTEVLYHKTFHRYTTRRKQGGSQSVNDNAKGNAKSAGATLRRYGEQALRDDIRNLIAEWADEINGCERIFIRASVSNRRIFFDYGDAIIKKDDERLRTYPFPTRRPTQSELSRCLLELTRVKISHLTEDALRAQDEAYVASLPKPKAQPAAPVPSSELPKPKQPKLTKEEEAYREKWTRLLEMVSKGRLEPLKSFWEREGGNLGGVDAPIPEWAGERWTSLLQVAAHAGQEATTQWLLDDAHADPTIDVPTGGPNDRQDDDGNQSDASDSPPTRVAGSRRTAYDIARTRAVRDVFRRSAGAYPDRWDWLGAARVPSVLSREMEEERDEKKKVRRKGLKERVKEREAKEREKEKSKPSLATPQASPPPQSSLRRDDKGPRKLGGAVGATEGVTGLTPEMRAKVERERRARAAEARLKNLGAR